MSIIVLENQALRVCINPFGAEMQSYFDKKNQRECLWQANPTYWGRHAPLLFPIVGRLAHDQLIHQAQSYPMTQHGFARNSLFKLSKKKEHSVQFRLSADQNTLKQYPFDFELWVDYQLQSNRLITRYTVHNQQNVILPASIGAHPAFNWPLMSHIPKEEHCIIFEHEETQPIRQLEQGLLLNETRANPIDNKQLMLNDHLFENDALIFDQLNSRTLHYQVGNKRILTLRFDDFPHLGIWSKLGAPFICFEPWQGYSSPVNFDGEFAQKPGVLLIPQHGEITKQFEIILN